jgi:hypothetical protein
MFCLLQLFEGQLAKAATVGSWPILTIHFVPENNSG